MVMTRGPFLFMAIFFVLTLTSGTVVIAAEKLTPEETAEKLQDNYELTDSFMADFTQVTSSKLSRRQRRGEGTLVISKPGLMRWDYLAPDHQVIICDGEKVLMYFASASQMIVMSAKEYLQSDVTYAFFAGTGDILRDFEVKEPPADYCCDPPPALQLFPRQLHPQVDHLSIWLGNDFLVTRMQISDLFGSLTDLHFTNIKRNQPVSGERFSFTPPPGTDIVEQ